MLQTYVTRVANQRSGAIAWILDDDSSLTNLTDGPNPEPFSTLLSSLKKMRSLAVDVVLGTVTGDPPVPPASTVRTQLVDLYHNLAWLLNLPPDSTLPDRSADNRTARAAARDFYYDLSRRDTHHLEWPFWLIPSTPGETARETTARMLASLPRILAGQAVFRPLLLETDRDIIASMRPSVQRGTNTFVFDLGAFSDFPNAAPSFAGSTLRRSDMIWALLNRYAGGRRIVSATLPVRHDRSGEAPAGLDLNRLVPDIRGYALYSALEDVLVRRRERRLRDGIGAEQPDDLKFRDADLDLGVARFRKYLTERTAALLLSCWRIQGLCKALERRANTAATSVTVGLSAFLAQARAAFDPTAVQKAVNQVLAVPPAEVRNFFRSLPAIVESHKGAAPVLPHKDAWFSSEREASARALAQAVAGSTPLRLLGAGGEGVVFAAAEIVIKVIDYSKRSPANGARDGMVKLAASTAALSGLYRPSLPPAPGGRQIICYPFEPSESYCGGRTTDILQILRDCRAAGIVTTNFHPKNLAVTLSGVKLIDYGSDIRPLTKEYYASMVQRAWLALRHHDREDLANLMRRALEDDTLPELEGWEALLAAADAPSKREVIDDALADIVRQWNPHTVLDFGCGHGRLAAALAGEGAQVTAYDPDESLRTRWNQLTQTSGSAVRWLSGPAEDALSGIAESFDTVICSLVLCIIEPAAEYHAALRCISKALQPGGRFAIAVCNPEATLDGDTTLQRRIPPPGASASDVFTWCKHLPSGTQRQDVHRPLSQLAKDLLAVGLTINTSTTTGGLGLDTLQPSRDFLILCGTKAADSPKTNGGPRSRKPSPLRRSPGNPPVLCYHRILPEAYDDAISRFQRRRGTVVDLAIFTHQLDEIRHFFTPISLPDYISWLCDGASLPQDACLLTFDDGYRDFLDFALPVLKQKGIPCALFPTVSAARGEALLPTDALYAALFKAERESSLSPDQVLDWVAGANKKRYIHADVVQQRSLLDEAGLEPEPIAPPSLYITEQEIAALPPGLVAIGGHGCRHELLVNKPLPDLRAELRRVRLWLETLPTGTAEHIPTLAYPNGSHDPVVAAAALEAGFAAAFTVEPWQPGRTDHRWRLGRSCVPNRVSAIADLVAGKELRI
jgi:SAM-dependent methyltransferase